MKHKTHSTADGLMWQKEFDLIFEIPFERGLGQLYEAEKNGIYLGLGKANPRVIFSDDSSAHFEISVGGASRVSLVAYLEPPSKETTRLQGKSGIMGEAIILLIGLAVLFIFAAVAYGWVGAIIAALVNLSVYFGLINARNNLMAQGIRIFHVNEPKN